MPKLKGIQFETAIIERYKRRECSVEEALIEVYLAGVSVRRVEDITETLWGTKVSSGTISNHNQKEYKHIEEWRQCPLTGEYPYVYVDGIYLKRCWGGEIQNVSVLVAIGVNKDGFREILGAAEGMKEDKESWLNFFTWLKSRGLTGVRLVVGDKCLGMLESIPVVFPEAKYQCCTVHFYRNVFTVTPKTKMKQVTLMLKAIHAQESKEAAQEKAASIAAKLREMKLLSAAKKVEESVGETLTYMDFPTEHWSRIRTNNLTERVNREIRRRTRAIGAFILFIPWMLQRWVNSIASYLRAHKKEPLMQISSISGVWVTITTVVFAKFFSQEYMFMGFLSQFAFSIPVVYRIYRNQRRDHTRCQIQ